MKAPFPRCVSLCRNGTQCGRRVSDGSNPPVCHVHSNQQALTVPAPFDANQKLLKIAANDKHPHQLQAIRLLRERDECETCKARNDSEDESGALVRAANPDQRARLSALLAAMREWKTDVRAGMANGAVPANPV
jgi:hypothetical protein